MKWKAKPYPKYGEHRVRSRFLLLPERWGDYWYWLENVYWVQEVKRPEADYWEAVSGFFHSYEEAKADAERCEAAYKRKYGG
jgi:hypothetical protein